MRFVGAFPFQFFRGRTRRLFDMLTGEGDDPVEIKEF